MSSNYVLTRYRQSSFSLTPTSDIWDRLSSPSLASEACIPSLSPSPARFRQPSAPADTQCADLTNPHSTNFDTTQSSDLFATLLLNRERAYRDSSSPAAHRLPERSERELRRTHTPASYIRDSSEDCFSRNSTGSPGHGRRRLDRRSRDATFRGEDPEEDKMRIRCVTQPKEEVPEVSLRRGRSAKKDTKTKTKEKVQESKTRKRKAVDDISREGSAAKVASKRVSRTDSKANISKKVDNSGGGMPAKSSAPDVIVISDDEDKAQKKEPVDREDKKMLQYRKRFFQSKKAPDISTPPKKEKDATPVPQISSRNLTPGCVVSDHASLIEELKKVHQELQVERDRVLSLRQEMEKREASTLLEREKYEAGAKQELEAERQRSREKDKSYQDGQTKQTKLETEHTALQAQLEQERTARKQEQDHHAEVLQEILKSKTEDEHTREQVQILQNDKARLLAENETLKTMSSAVRKLPTLSPVPSSSSSTDEERRDENVRKMYIKVKRQYDILHSVANELAVCTRSMDLSSFGEFGSYLKKLRNSLDTDGRASAEGTQNSWKADEDTDSETKRSLA